MKGRPLRPSERLLWERVARTVAPLAGSVRVDDESVHPTRLGHTRADAPHATHSSAPADAASPAIKSAKPSAKAPHTPLTPTDLDRKTRRKLARGLVTIDGRIDLHGLTLEQADAALSRFVERSAVQGRRVVLVITGKGRGGEGRGILRRSVPVWLARKDLQRHVVSFGPAHPNHGGDGALYVRLRTHLRHP